MTPSLPAIPIHVVQEDLVNKLQQLTTALDGRYPGVEFDAAVDGTGELVVRWDNRRHPQVDENVVVDTIRDVDGLLRDAA